MRIGLKKKHAHTKSVARLVDSENCSKKKQQQHAQHNTKSVASLVDSENWSKKNVYTKKKTLHTISVTRLVDSENWSNIFFFINSKTTKRTHKKCC